MKGSDLIKRNKQENKNNIPIPLIILIILLILFLIIISIFFSKKIIYYKYERQLPAGVNLTVDPDSKYKNNSPENFNEEHGVAVSGINVMTIRADTEYVSTDLYNPKENYGYYFMTFELRICTSETEQETLYTSGLVEPGKHIYNITLSHSLEKGVYNAVLHIQPYRMDREKTPTNNADIKFRLVVE